MPRIVCFLITTEDAEKRTRDSKAWLQRFSGPGQFAHELVVIETVRKADNRQGCFEAHQLAVRHFLQDAVEGDTCLIFENDCVWAPTVDDAAINKRIMDAVQFVADRNATGFTVDLLFLGHMPLGKMTPVGTGCYGAIYHSEASALTHAYMMSYAFARRVAGWVYMGQHYDQALLKATPHQFAIYPMLVFQQDLPGAYSRLLDRVLAVARNKVGTIRIMKCLERIMVSSLFPAWLGMRGPRNTQ